MADFKKFLSIPSISTDDSYGDDVKRAAEWVGEKIRALNFDEVKIVETKGHPVVYAELKAKDPNAKTVLIYAHYDVQPVDPLEEWSSGPFEPEVRDGKLFARGVIDDKFGVWANLKAIHSIREVGAELPFTVKLLFEGEEEAGSPSIEAFIRENKKLLESDLLVVCDGVSGPEEPEYNYSARGIIVCDVEVQCPEKDYHSGTGGGIVQNPVHLISKMIASLHDEEGRILVKGAYDGIVPLSKEEQEYFSSFEDEYVKTMKKNAGDFVDWGIRGKGFFEKTTAMPSIDINGVFGGYQGAGSKTVIPAKAGFKFSMRLAPDQDVEAITENIVAHFKAFEKPGVKIEISGILTGKPILMLREGPIVDVLRNAFSTAWGKEFLMLRSGGSIPLLGLLRDILGMPMIDFTINTGGQMHSPDEYMILEHFDINIETVIRFLLGLKDH